MPDLPFWFLDSIVPGPCERCGADDGAALYWSDSEPDSRTRSIWLCPRCTAATVPISGNRDS